MQRCAPILVGGLLATVTGVACSGEKPYDVTVRVLVVEEVYRPQYLLMSWWGPKEWIIQNRRIPEQGDLPEAGADLAKVLVAVSSDPRGERRVIVRGMRGEQQISGAAKRVRLAGRAQEIALSLGRLVDSDGDGIPDEVDDDCPSSPCAGAGDAGPQSGPSGDAAVAPDGGALGRAEAGGGADGVAGGSDSVAADAIPGGERDTNVDASVGVDRAVDSPNTPDVSGPQDAAKDGPPPGLVAYWNFEEGSGLRANDSSGSGNHAALIGGPTWTTGRSGGALSFDGVDDLVLAPDSPSLDVTGQVTLAAWIKYTRPEDNRNKSMVAKADSLGTNLSYGLMCGYDTSMFFAVRVGGVIHATARYPGGYDTVWHHVVGVYDGSSLQLWVDGVKREEKLGVPGRIEANDEALRIGDVGFFPGVIDEVRIYNRALSSSEITQLLTRVGP